MSRMYKIESKYLVATLIIVSILGFSMSFLLTDNSNDVITVEKFSRENVLFNGDIFISIIFKNLLVGIIISIVGFLTAGLLSIAVFFWNAFWAGLLIKQSSFLAINSILSFFVYHGIFEIIAFGGFGIVGLQGFVFYVNLFKYDRIVINVKYQYFIFSTLLLIIAAIFETILISSHI